MNGSDSAVPTVWILGDQLSRTSGALKDRNPGDCHRMSRQFAGMRRLSDLPEVRHRAVEALKALDAGTL